MTLRRAVHAVAAALALLLAPVAPAAEPLVVASALLPVNLPMFVADAEGYFAAEGVQVKLLDCAFGRICLRSMLEGRAQLATVADLPIVLASFETDRFAIIATLNTNRNDTKLIVRAGGGIGHVAKLAGRRVGTMNGTTADYVLDTTLRLSGIDPALQHTVEVAPSDPAGPLLRGEVDALALFEPYAHAALRALGRDGQVLRNAHRYDQTWNLLARRDVAGARDGELRALLRALLRAQRLIERDPARAQAILRARLGIDADAVEWIWHDQLYALSLDQSLIATLEGQARWALRTGHAQGRAPNYLRLVHDAPLRSVLPAAVTLVR